MLPKNYKNSYISAGREFLSLSVYNVGCELCGSGHQWGPGIRDHYLIHYVISGAGSYRVGGKTYPLSAGDAFLVYPNTEVIYRADEKNPWEYAWVGFTGSDAAAILRATDFRPESPCIFCMPDGDSLKQQLLSIYEIRGNEFRHAVEMTGRLYAALAVFIQGSHKKESENTALSYVQKCMDYISANYSYPLTVEELAAYVGLSRSQLFRSFEAVINQSPKEYLTDFRMRQACDLLAHSDLSVTAIANSVGFDNSLYFSKTFRRKKGMPPSKYRSTHTQG